ncbi:MAG: glycosyltransferase family 4 protein [Thermoplasmata archaeon]|nr:glycosyltransferase family 4 protein [Thermoplasmata archaeon]
MAEKKNVLMLLSNPFRPDPRVYKEAKSLITAGYDVTILCWDREQAHPVEEIIDGIKIIRLGPASGYGKSGDFVRALPKFWKNLRKKALKLKFDIIHAHDLDTLSPGLKLASKFKIPLIYDSHEIYHEMAAENLSPFFTGLLARYEKKMVRKPDIMITVNESIAELFRGFGVKDIRVVMNCQPDVHVDKAEAETLKKELSPDGKQIALYIGVLEPNRLLLELAEAHIKGNGNFLLVLGGFGSLEPKLKSMAEKNPNKIKFIGRIKPSEVPNYNHAADILLATYDPGLRNNRLGAPNKLFESMSASKPIVVTKGTYAAEVVEKTGCGISTDYTGKAAISSIVALLEDKVFYDKCAVAGRNAYEEKYNWTVMEKRLLDAYSMILK